MVRVFQLVNKEMTRKKNVKCWVQGPCQTAILRKIRCRWARMANMYKMTLASSSS